MDDEPFGSYPLHPFGTPSGESIGAKRGASQQDGEESGKRRMADSQPWGERRAGGAGGAEGSRAGDVCPMQGSDQELGAMAAVGRAGEGSTKILAALRDLNEQIEASRVRLECGDTDH